MDPPPPRAAAGPFTSCLTLLSPHLPSSETPTQQLSQIDQAIRATHEWCNKLSQSNSPPDSKTLEELYRFLEVSLLDFQVDSANCFSPSTSTNRNDSPLHGPRPQPQTDGEKVSAIVHVIKELLTGLNERAASQKDGDWWYRIGNAINAGLVTHLEENGVGKKTAQDLAYRTFICFTIVEALVRLVVPDPNKLPKSSADDLGGLGRNPKEMAVKYSALDVLGDLLSKNEQNKAILLEILKPEHLGSILHASWDHHLSHLAFELAFRLLPTKQAPESRENFLKELFSEDVFGKGKDDMAKSLRKKMDRLNVSTNWDEGYQWILKKISQMHIRRSQFFEMLSMEYNHQQLLVPRDRGSESELNQPTPSLKSVLEESFYESKLLWFSRHLLAASLTVRADSDAEETEERMVIPLDGIVKVYVHDLGVSDEGKEIGTEEKLDCLKITFLIDPSHPLTISTKPHPSEPSHVGSILNAISETQAEEFAAVGEEKQKYHELVVLIKRTGEIAKILHETLLDRGKQYPNMLKEISDFPTIASRPRSRPSTAAQNPPAPPPPQPQPLPQPLPEPKPAAQSEDREEQQQRRVAFAPTPDNARPDPKNKSSGTDGLEGKFVGGPEAVEKEQSIGSKEKGKEASQGSQGEKRAEMEAFIAEEDSKQAAGGGGGKEEAAGDGEGSGDEKARSSEGVAQQKSPKQNAATRSANVSATAATASEESKKPSKSDKSRKKQEEEEKARTGKAGEDSSDLSDAESVHDKMEDGDEKSKSRKERKDMETEKAKAVQKGKANQEEELGPRSKSVSSTYSRSSKAAAAKKKKEKEQDPFDVEQEEEEEEAEEETKSTSSSRRKTRGRSPAAPKKVVATTSRKPVSKKAAAAPPAKTTGKRGRSQKEEEEEVEDDDEESSQGESEGSDLPHPDDLAKSSKSKSKKVVKPSTKSKSSKPAPPKRRKTSTSTKMSDNDNDNKNNEEQDTSTDYDMPVRSLEPKKNVRHQAKKYGTEKKSPAKSNGTKKKAGKGQKGGTKKKSDAMEVEEDTDVQDQTEEATVASRNRPTRAAAKKSKPVVEEDSDQAEEDGEVVDSASRGKKSTKSGGTKLGGKEKKVVASKPIPASKPVHEPEKQKAKGRRTLESTPPPLDVDTSTKAAIVKPPQTAPSASETASNQPRKSFSELIELPPDNTREATEHDGAANEEDLGGFDAGDFYQENDAEERDDSEKVSPSRAQFQAAQVEPVLSPVPDPAKIDTSYVDQEFSQHEQQVDNGQGPQVLVADTPEPSAQQLQSLAQAGTVHGVQLGNHRITSERRELEGDQGEDAEMEDGEFYQEAGYDLDNEADYEEENEDGAVEGEIETKGSRVVADDSGVHFAPSPAKRAGGGREALNRGPSKAVQQEQAPPPVARTTVQSYGKAQLQAPSARPRPQAVQQQAFVSPRLKKARPSAAAPSRPVPHPAPSRYYTSTTHPRPAARTTHAAPVGRQPRRNVAVSEQPPVRHPARQSIASSSTIKPRAARPRQPRHSPAPVAASAKTASTSRVNQDLSKSRPRSRHVKSRSQDRDLGHEDPQGSIEEEEEGEGEETDFDEDEEELYDSLVGAAGLIVRKNRERRLERQQHNEEARGRLEGPLLEFMNTVADDNAEIIARAKALSITATDPNNPGALNPAQSLMSACQETMDECDSLWTQLQYQLNSYDTPDGETTLTDQGPGGAAGGTGAGAGAGASGSGAGRR